MAVGQTLSKLHVKKGKGRLRETSFPPQSFLPARASEQGNVIRSVRIYMCTKKIVIERTRDLIYLKFVATDFFPKIISLSAGENSGDLA